MLSLAAIGALLVGCHSGQANLSDPTESPLTWSLMEYDQRFAHMRNVVLPLAQEVFGAWRPEKRGHSNQYRQFVKSNSYMLFSSFRAISVFGMERKALRSEKGDPQC